MTVPLFKKLLIILGALAAVWLGVKYLLPVLLPFLLGAVIALAAEPMVSLTEHRLKLSRTLSAGIGVSMTLVMLIGILSATGAILVRELGKLAGAVPDLEGTARQGMLLLQDWLVGMTEQAPEGVRPVLTKTVLNFFDDGTALVEQVSQRIPKVVTSALGWVPDGALSIGTGLLAGFMISARLPRLKAAAIRHLPESWNRTYLPGLRRVRTALLGWLRAQLKLSAVTYGIVAVGFLLLRVSYGPLLAVLVALVDAVPLLGTGTALIPWAVVCLLQGNHFRAIGLFCIFGAAALTRTVLEPRLVGRQLGLDPLLTLLALYLGYKVWGIGGMILAPLLATAVKSIVQPAREPGNQS